MEETIGEMTSTVEEKEQQAKCYIKQYKIIKQNVKNKKEIRSKPAAN